MVQSLMHVRTTPLSISCGNYKRPFVCMDYLRLVYNLERLAGAVYQSRLYHISSHGTEQTTFNHQGS